MGLFSRNKSKKIAYRRKSDEQIEKSQARKEKQWARDKLLEKAKTNPDLENQYISKLMGIDIKPQDTTIRHRQEIKEIVDKEALEEIKNDPELRKEFARDRVGEILEESSGRRGGGGRYGETSPYDSPVSTIRQALEELDELDEFRNRVGGKGKGGILNEVFTGDNINLFLKFLTGMGKGNISGGAITQESQESTVIIKSNGKLVRVTESQFLQLEEQGKIQPAGVLEEEKIETEEKPSPTVPPEESVQEEELELPEIFSIIDLSQIAAYLEQSPEDFVEQLKFENQEGLPQSKLTWNFLSASTYDIIVQVIKPYENHSEVGIHVQKLLADESRDWLEKVLVIIKEENIE